MEAVLLEVIVTEVVVMMVNVEMVVAVVRVGAEYGCY